MRGAWGWGERLMDSRRTRWGIALYSEQDGRSPSRWDFDMSTCTPLPQAPAVLLSRNLGFDAALVVVAVRVHLANDFDLS